MRALPPSQRVPTGRRNEHGAVREVEASQRHPRRRLRLIGAWLAPQVACTILPLFGPPQRLPRSLVIRPAHHAALLTLFGERDRAFAELDACAQQHPSSATGLLWTGVFDPPRDDPGYAALLLQMKLPYRPAGAPLP